MAIVENLLQQYRRAQQQTRLRIIKRELDSAQRECALLGAKIGQLIRRKSEIEIEIARGEM